MLSSSVLGTSVVDPVWSSAGFVMNSESYVTSVGYTYAGNYTVGEPEMPTTELKCDQRMQGGDLHVFPRDPCVTAATRGYQAKVGLVLLECL